MFIRLVCCQDTMTSFIVEPYGSWQSIAHAQQMAALLVQAHFDFVDSVDAADIVIINSSNVDAPTADLIVKRLEEFKQRHPYKLVIIAGCIPPPKLAKPYSVLNSHQIHRIVEVVEETLSRNILKLTEVGELPPLNLTKIRTSSIIEIIPITLGCLRECVWCRETPTQADQPLQSYPIAEIVEVARQALREGSKQSSEQENEKKINIKEIWLASVDSTSYGCDIGTNLAQLLPALVGLPGEFRILLSPAHIASLRSCQDELIGTLQHPKIFQYLHLPAYAGSTKVLGELKQGHTAAQFRDVIKLLRTHLPVITIATNVVIGFPTETDDDFWQTLDLVRNTSPDTVEIISFVAQPKTSHARLPALGEEELARRHKVISDIAHNTAILQNERWRTWQGSIIIDEQGELPGEWIGHNDSYKPVSVNGMYKLGDVVRVKILRATTPALKGEVMR